MSNTPLIPYIYITIILFKSVFSRHVYIVSCSLFLSKYIFLLDGELATWISSFLTHTQHIYTVYGFLLIINVFINHKTY